VLDRYLSAAGSWARPTTSDLKPQVDRKFEKVDQRFDSVTKEIGQVKDSLASAKIWALGLCSALATSLLFFVLAKGFKWL
jgi:hypothetical protein